ncbi:hypothetical protein [Halomonas sp. H5]|uniref:hypothetical protein n=1 Tax=Halomonas sp. H5 TaxID=3423910 RepID=UPI003D359B5D
MTRMTLALIVTALLAGCSYTPARITPEPLIEIDSRGGHHHHRSHRGGFCPPGLAMQGRC